MIVHVCITWNNTLLIIGVMWSPAAHHADWHEDPLVAQFWPWPVRTQRPWSPCDLHHGLRRLLLLPLHPAGGLWVQGGGGQQRASPCGQGSVSCRGGAADAEGGGGEGGEGGVHCCVPRALSHPGGAEGAAGGQGAGGRQQRHRTEQRRAGQRREAGRAVPTEPGGEGLQHGVGVGAAGWSSWWKQTGEAELKSRTQYFMFYSLINSWKHTEICGFRKVGLWYTKLSNKKW